MELIRRTFFARPNKDRRYTIAEAVERECSPDRDGELERTRDAVNKAIEKLGQLMQELHESGALKDKQIETLLPSFERATDPC